jgi:hypothetical protein
MTLSDRLAAIYTELGAISREASEAFSAGVGREDTSAAVATARAAVLHACNRANFDEGCPPGEVSL